MRDSKYAKISYGFCKMLIYNLSAFIVSLLWIKIATFDMKGPTGITFFTGVTLIALTFSSILSSVVVFMLQRATIKSCQNYIARSRSNIINRSLIFEHLLLYNFVLCACIGLPSIMFDPKLFVFAIALCVLPIMFISLAWLAVFILEIQYVSHYQSLGFPYKPWVLLLILAILMSCLLYNF